jgi:hypothetical protein
MEKKYSESFSEFFAVHFPYHTFAMEKPGSK